MGREQGPGRELLAVASVPLTWVLGVALMTAYADHFLLMDRGWEIHYGLIFSFACAVLALVVATVIYLVTKIVKLNWRPGFALLHNTVFAIAMIATVAAQLPDDLARRAQSDEQDYWSRNQDYQDCIAQGRKQTLRVRAIEEACKARLK